MFIYNRSVELERMKLKKIQSFPPFITSDITEAHSPVTKYWFMLFYDILVDGDISLLK